VECLFRREEDAPGCTASSFPIRRRWMAILFRSSWGSSCSSRTDEEQGIKREMEEKADTGVRRRTRLFHGDCEIHDAAGIMGSWCTAGNLLAPEVAVMLRHGVIHESEARSLLARRRGGSPGSGGRHAPHVQPVEPGSGGCPDPAAGTPEAERPRNSIRTRRQKPKRRRGTTDYRMARMRRPEKLSQETGS